MIEKRKSIIRKLLFIVLSIISLMIISNTKASAASFPNSFNMGTLDLFGGEGITSGPETYLFGDYYCGNHNLPLTRTEDGTKGGRKLVHLNRNNSSYYNEQITYTFSKSVEIEQSIAGGRLAYENGGGSKVELQKIVWASGQWNGKPGYVNNLPNYTGTTTSASNVLEERAGAWANFYYNILQVSGNKIIIQTSPTDENEMRVYVDQDARTYTQGPYKIDIIKLQVFLKK